MLHLIHHLAEWQFHRCIVALATSITITVSVVFTGSYHVPPPFMGDRSAAQDRLDARFNTEPAKSIYNSIQLQDY